MASARSRCSSSCSARSSEPPNDGAVCASRSSNSDRSPLSEKNSTTNIMLQSRRWPGQPSPEFPANPSLDRAAKELDRALIVNPHETDAVVSALKRALAMPLAERRERHGPMLAHLLEN